MTIETTVSGQKRERKTCLDAICSSKSKKRIIVAGAGTGKTFTLKEVLLSNIGRNSIAMTFINRLTDDMDTAFGDLAEVKTFHAYCKKILHEQNGKVELKPFLTKIIEQDASHLNKGLKDFDKKFQTLDERSPEVAFYLKRGDYYDAVSFNDSVYRLYTKLRNNSGILPDFNQILIDEYQDFNALEVAFIDELEKKGSILIIGDDDQAVYDERCASPTYLRDKYKSGKYDKFELPFCSRCPQVIVEAAYSFLSNAESNGFLKGRIKKRYDCFMEEKGKDSIDFPKIITAQCTTGQVVAQYVDRAIQKISKEDIEESWNLKYYTVLIVGSKQYLVIVKKALTRKYPQILYTPNKEITVNLIDGYEILLNDVSNNLGWRVLMNFYFRQEEVKAFIQESAKGKSILDILDDGFIRQQKRAIEIIRTIRIRENITNEIKSELRTIVNSYYDNIVEHFALKEQEEKDEPDKTKPSILLSSFVGCKGLSAGHVIIVGANNGSVPKDPQNINDVEIAQFMVALTRTRKQCHIIANKWLIKPKNGNTYQEPFGKSCFLDWIPHRCIEDKGLTTAKVLK